MLLYSGIIGSPLQGALTLLIFSLGLSLPYLIIAATFGKVLPLIQKMSRFVIYMSRASGLILVSFGILMLTDKMHLLEDLVFHALDLPR